MRKQTPKVFPKKNAFLEILPQPATLLKKRLPQVFSCEFCEISKNIFFTEHLGATVSKMTLGNGILCDHHSMHQS